MNGVLPECLLESLFKIQAEIIIINSKLHKIFYKMKNNPEYEDLFENIRFLGSPVSPYSEVLDEALFNLQFAGILFRKNPDLVIYSTTPRFDSSYEKLIHNLPPDTIRKLEKFSIEFLEKMN
jgi:hypothetical protein